MGDGLRTIRVASTDTLLLNQAKTAAESLEGWEMVGVETIGDLLAAPPMKGDVILIDKFLRGDNVYDVMKRMAGKTACRIYLVAEHASDAGDGVARFCGATGVLHTPLTPSALATALGESAGPRAPLPTDLRETTEQVQLPEALLVSIADSKPDVSLVSALTDPDTSLFNYAFLNYKLDEEFKRAQRFSHPLACVMLGFEGQASEQVLRELAGIFLLASRDTDVLGRFDESSFLFFLPNTGPDGARVMAERIKAIANDRGLSDLVGDPLDIAAGISFYPHVDITRREDLFGRAREAFLAARAEGTGLVTAG